MSREEKLQLQGTIEYDDNYRKKLYIANLMYQYPVVENIEIGVPLGINIPYPNYETEKRVELIQKEDPKIKREKKIVNIPGKSNTARIDYINKASNTKSFIPQKVEEKIEMKMKIKKPESNKKDYNEIAMMFYPNMDEVSQIQVKKEEQPLLGKSRIDNASEIITLADKEYTVKSAATKDEKGDREIYANKNQNWIIPVSEKYVISSKYGYRTHPVLKERRFHDGVDIAVPINTPVRAVADGVVERVLWNGGYGKYVQIKHNNSLTSFYAHLNSWDVKVGDIVKQGQEIAKSGNTAGKSPDGRIMTTGPHLHFGAKKNGKKIDPLILLNKI